MEFAPAASPSTNSIFWRPMRRRHSLILVALLAAFAAAAEAQDTPDNLVSRCPECDELAGKARAARTRMQQADAVLKDASAARSKATADLIVLNLEVAAMRRIKPPLTNAQEARLNELQARRDAAEPAADAADARYTEASVAFVVALEQYANLSGELFACNKLCE